MRTSAAVAAATLLVAPLIAACGSGSATDGPAPVVASFYPLQYVAERVSGDLADVSGLTSPGVEPHDLELSLRETAELEEAAVVVYLSGLQPAVDEAVEQADPVHVVDAATVVDLLPAPGALGEPAGHDEHDAAADGPADLHLWLDPLRLAEVATAVADALAAADPEHATEYVENERALVSELRLLDTEIAEGLGDCERTTVVVSHNAFGYFAARYGLRLRPISGLSPDAEPSPAHLAQIAGVIRDEGVTTVFTERLASPRLAETLAEELGLRTDVLDPVEGLTEDTADEDYLSLMRANLDALRAANGCS